MSKLIFCVNGYSYWNTSLKSTCASIRCRRTNPFNMTAEVLMLELAIEPIFYFYFFGWALYLFTKSCAIKWYIDRYRYTYLIFILVYYEIIAQHLFPINDDKISINCLFDSTWHIKEIYNRLKKNILKIKAGKLKTAPI